MFGRDGLLYACQSGARKIVRFDNSGTEESVLDNVDSNDIAMLPHGGYFTDPKNHKVWYFTRDGKRKLVDRGIEFPNGVIASPDQSLLTVADSRGRFSYSFQIQPDGTLRHKQRYGHLHVPDDSAASGADGLTVDTEGRTYVATKLGTQVLDQPGRVHLIIAKPQSAKLSNIVFAGKNRDVLYATSVDKVYRRKINARGVISRKPPVKQPRPRL